MSAVSIMVSHSSGMCSISHSSVKWCMFRFFSTRLMDSTPPATMIGTLSTMMRCAATAIACRPELQNRLMVVAAVVTGKPARIAARRAMFLPVAPSGLAQPRTTSSTSSGSMPARSTARAMTCPAMTAPWVALKAPRNALPIGVRAVETITASAITSIPQYTLSPTPECPGGLMKYPG